MQTRLLPDSRFERSSVSFYPPTDSPFCWSLCYEDRLYSGNKMIHKFVFLLAINWNLKHNAKGLFRFQDSTGVENGARENRGFPCVVSLIEHYAAKYREMDVLALRYPVSKDDVIHEEAEEHLCYVESPNEDAAETPRRIHPELAASLAGSTQTCNRYFNH
jgi:hypothetical protein